MPSRIPVSLERYCESITPPTRRLIWIHAVTTACLAMAVAGWRLRSGLALIGDSGSYLAGAAGLSNGRWFETPLVASFSEVPLLDTVRSGGWSPYADFGIGLPIVIAVFDIVFPLVTAAAIVNVAAIGVIAAGVVVGPWSPTSRSDIWMRSLVAIAVTSWPIMRFTTAGVLSEPMFCAALLWLAILVIRSDVERTSRLVSLGLLSVLVGTTRFVGPIVTIVIAVLLLQRGVSRRRVGLWAVISGIVPIAATLVTSTSGTRTMSFHGLDTSDVFFTARGIGGWFEAGFGDQTATLFRLDFQPGRLHWIIAVGALVCAVIVLIRWFGSFRRHIWTPLQPVAVLAATLALAVVPSMLFLDAVVKLDNRILMPSGLLMICAGGWKLAQSARVSLAWSIVGLWVVVATHPWNWLDRPDSPRATALTEAVDRASAPYVLTNNADLVWWITRVPARYLPDGYHDLSDRAYDPLDIMVELPCALARTNGIIVADAAAILPTVSVQLTNDVAAGRYTIQDVDGIVTYTPTGVDC